MQVTLSPVSAAHVAGLGMSMALWLEVRDFMLMEICGGLTERQTEWLEHISHAESDPYLPAEEAVLLASQIDALFKDGSAPEYVAEYRDVCRVTGHEPQITVRELLRFVHLIKHSGGVTRYTTNNIDEV